MTDRWVCLDVGETLVDETRVWTVWAHQLGVTPLTLMAALGAAIARGGSHHEAFSILGADDWRERLPALEVAYGGFMQSDLYTDARRAVDGLRARGYRLAIIGNQPASRSDELRAIGVTAEVMAMSDAMGVAKPDPAFFARALELMGSPSPGSVAYVGDRVDNDVIPAAQTGMRAIWIRRGPWARIGPPPSEGIAALAVGSLDELVERIGEAWA